MRKTSLALSITLISAGLAGGQVMAQQQSKESEPQGLYSAEDIIDADVYMADNPDEEVGEVEDILLDDSMRVQALVIESGTTLGLGGREIVLDNDSYRLETFQESDGDTEHRILVDSSAEELGDMPEYNENWWNQTRQQAREAWEATREGAQSAWQSTREGAANVADSISDSVENGNN